MVIKVQLESLYYYLMWQSEFLRSLCTYSAWWMAHNMPKLEKSFKKFKFLQLKKNLHFRFFAHCVFFLNGKNSKFLNIFGISGPMCGHVAFLGMYWAPQKNIIKILSFFARIPHKHKHFSNHAVLITVIIDSTGLL